MSVYIINGVPGSGKTTFEYMVKDIVGEDYCYICSTIDFVKKVARLCGWDGEKRPEDRKFLSDLKKILTDWGDVPHNNTVYAVKQYLYWLESFDIDTKKSAVFIDCREPKEIDKLKKAFEDAKAVLISRKEAENKRTSNLSDSEVLSYNYDIIINNDEDLKQLAEEAKLFVSREGLHEKLDI